MLIFVRFLRVCFACLFSGEVTFLLRGTQEQYSASILSYEKLFISMFQEETVKIKFMHDKVSDNVNLAIFYARDSYHFLHRHPGIFNYVP